METSYKVLGRELIRRSGQTAGRRGARAIVPVVTAAFLSAGLAAPAMATASSQHPQKYTISSVPSGKVVDITNNSHTAGTPTILYHNHHGANQEFQLDAAHALFPNYMIVNPYLRVNQNFCLTSDYHQAPNSTDFYSATQQPCNGSSSQEWYSRQGAHGVQIVNAGNGTCLDVAGNNTADGTPIGTYQCNGQPNQEWNFQKD
ncbi:RICIN domain-containing protein [Streptacidiphilus albus]|uniref:RICIN domain-containing protein n=1 Tax=Streptacidiphilus albus TaxID=105425 RepID=UPI00054B490C|nr:RICIN domain-containing protein [Streptacidiphilus albus]